MSVSYRTADPTLHPPADLSETFFLNSNLNFLKDSESACSGFQASSQAEKDLQPHTKKGKYKSKMAEIWSPATCPERSVKDIRQRPCFPWGDEIVSFHHSRRDGNKSFLQTNSSESLHLRLSIVSLPCGDNFAVLWLALITVSPTTIGFSPHWNSSLRRDTSCSLTLWFDKKYLFSMAGELRDCILPFCCDKDPRLHIYRMWKPKGRILLKLKERKYLLLCNIIKQWYGRIHPANPVAILDGSALESHHAEQNNSLSVGQSLRRRMYGGLLLLLWTKLLRHGDFSWLCPLLVQ